MSNEEDDSDETPRVYTDDMAPEVRRCFERGNEIREAKRQIHEDVQTFTQDLLELYPGQDDAIRKGLEGAAADLLAKRDRKKRNDRERTKGNGVTAVPGANGVSKTLHAVVQRDPENGDGDTGPEAESD